MKDTISAGGIILNRRGEVALVTNGASDSWWGFPKGHVDPGEDVLEAARREIQEETGLTDLTMMRAFAPYTRFKGTPQGVDDTSERKTIHMFLFSTTADTLKSQDPQNPLAEWVPKGKVASLLAHNKDREFFLTVLPLI